mmetsp:Transcript_15674/g.24515  ORF Transcript_15674/g.24515 Transcript_15674/m.24515 type:complete len:343 (-) Transcript_15674:16-1044(-)
MENQMFHLCYHGLSSLLAILRKMRYYRINLGKKTHWEDHFNYLQKFFSHDNYIKILGEPVFMIHRWELLSNLSSLLECWTYKSIKMDVPNVKIILEGGGLQKRLQIEKLKTRHPLFLRNHPTPHYPGEKLVHGIIDPLWPLSSQRKLPSKNAIHTDDLMDNTTTIYWGAHTGMPGNSIVHKHVNITPTLFSEALTSDFARMSMFASKSITLNYYFLNSWNSWKDQAVLEPDNQYGTAFLDAIKYSLSHITTYDNSGTGDEDIELNLDWKSSKHILSKDYETNEFYKMFHSESQLQHSVLGRQDAKAVATEKIEKKKLGDTTKTSKKDWTPRVHNKYRRPLHK